MLRDILRARITIESRERPPRLRLLRNRTVLGMSHRWSEPTAASSLLNAVAAESVVRRFCPTKERATKDVEVLGTAR